jgi:hypothetical protein
MFKTKEIFSAIVITLLVTFQFAVSSEKDLAPLESLTGLFKNLKEEKVMVNDVKGGDPNSEDFTKPTDQIILLTESGKIFSYKKEDSVLSSAPRKSAYLSSGEIVLFVSDGKIQKSYGKIGDKWDIGVLMEEENGNLYFVRMNTEKEIISIRSLEVKGRGFKLGDETVRGK